jgi:predicted DNA-binding protein (UPF0251 family)/DNA-directed RNA polymerase subunit RPC12/RpoP
MGRRTRMRFVRPPPSNAYFPREIDDSLKQNAIILTIAEFEAMRLKHYVDLPQGEGGHGQKSCSEIMGVSQPTFSRILDKAHQKVTKALGEGKNIIIAGGNIEIKEIFNGYGCLNCNNEWKDSLASKDRKVVCPKCKSEKTYHLIREPL